MPRRRTSPKPKKSGDKPDARRSTRPKTPHDQVNAISDDIKSEVIAYIHRLYLEQGLLRQSMRQVLGVGGNDLELYVEQFKKNYADAVPSEQAPPKDEQSWLKQKSTDTKVELVIPKQKSDGKDSKPSKPSSSSRRR
jgi:hypothetical protein